MHGAIQECHFWTEPIVNADREKAGSKKHASLGWTYVFAGEHDMATTVDHKGWMKRAGVSDSIEWLMVQLTDRAGLAAAGLLLGVVNVRLQRDVANSLKGDGL